MTNAWWRIRLLKPSLQRSGRAQAVRLLAVAALVVATLSPVPVGADGGFDDVAGNTHEKSVVALSELGVFEDTECGEGLFCPAEPIERWVFSVVT